MCQQDIKSNDRFLIKVFLALKKRHLRNRPFLPEMLICKNATVELQQRPAIGSRVCRHAVRGRETTRTVRGPGGVVELMR